MTTADRGEVTFRPSHQSTSEPGAPNHTIDGVSLSWLLSSARVTLPSLSLSPRSLGGSRMARPNRPNNGPQVRVSQADFHIKCPSTSALNRQLSVLAVTARRPHSPATLAAPAQSARVADSQVQVASSSQAQASHSRPADARFRTRSPSPSSPLPLPQRGENEHAFGGKVKVTCNMYHPFATTCRQAPF